jgi:hypothetical protein
MAKKKVKKAEEPVVAAVPEVASSAATQAVLKTSGEEDARAAAEKKAWCVYKPTHPLIHGQKHFKITFSQFKVYMVLLLLYILIYSMMLKL